MPHFFFLVLFWNAVVVMLVSISSFVYTNKLRQRDRYNPYEPRRSHVNCLFSSCLIHVVRVF